MEKMYSSTIFFVILLLEIFVGFIGLVFFLSSPEAPLVIHMLLAGCYFTIPAIVVGIIKPRFWYMAAMVAWGPTVMGVPSVIIGVTQQMPEVWWNILLFLPMLLTLLGGYAGAKARKIVEKRKVAKMEQQEALDNQTQMPAIHPQPSAPAMPAAKVSPVP